MKFIIAAVLSISLCACGGGGGESGSKSSSSVIASSKSSSSVQSSSSSSLSSTEEASSSISSQESSTAISPLAEGSGTFSTKFVLNGTYKIDEVSGNLTELENPLEDNYVAADIDPEGIVIAVSANSGNVDRIDLISGEAKTIFTAPEVMSAVAVSSDGTIVTISRDEEFSKKYIYRFSAAGEQLSKVVSEDFNPNGIDFTSDGTLVGVDLFGTWTINPVTGMSSSLFLTAPNGQGDIDISSSGELRVYMSGKLEIYSISTGESIKSITLQHDYFSFSPIIHR